jgi:NDP-sugar pyrophosphorylase family protein
MSDVVILAGGKGTRLSSVSGETPKVLMPVAGRPFLSHLLDQVRHMGARRVILSTGFQAQQVDDFVAGLLPIGLKVLTSVEPEPLGTGGGLRHALPKIESTSVLVMNGDSYVDTDFRALEGAHAKAITLLLTDVPDTARFGRVESDAAGAVTAFTEKGAAGPGAINAGVYLVERSVIESIPAGRAVSLEREIFPAYIGRGLRAVRGAFRFIDIGTPDSYREAENFFRNKRR